MAAEITLTLLSDQPVAADGQRDLLGRSAEADRLAELLRDSRAAAPFTLAVHADWGMGKSSLLRQTAERLREDVQTEVVWFNAWMAGGNGLEGLIKSVLDKLDARSLRRLARAVSGESAAASWAKVLVRGVAGTLRLHHLVDGIWEQLAVDQRTRNNAQDLLRKTLNDWTSGSPAGGRRTIVVFVDDLDRCPPESIRTVCEAVKQYLNVPGLVFVFGCDRSIVEAAIADSRSAAGGGREFLEKIIQASYPVAAPDDAQVSALISGYAQAAGAGALFHGAVAEAVAQHAGRNPRRIKQLINRFVIEYRLDPEWSALFGADALIRVALLQDLYPGFYRLLSQAASFDPLEEMGGYISALRVARSTDPEADAALESGERETAVRWLGLHDVAAADGVISDEAVARVEQELPEDFPALARDKTFLGLVEALTAAAESHALRAKLRRTRLDWAASAAPDGIGYAAAPAQISGIRVLRLNTRGKDSLLSQQIVQAGVHLAEVETGAEALEHLAEEQPQLVITNLYRPDPRIDGFDDVAAIRRAYSGPIVIYTLPVTPALRTRAREISALITDSPSQVAQWIVEAASGSLPDPNQAAPIEQPLDLVGTHVIWLAPQPNTPLTSHLEARGVQVRSTPDAAEAVRMARERPPDAVIADPFIGDDGRWGVFANIHKLRREATYDGPIIVLSQRVSGPVRSMANRMDVEVTEDLAAMTRALVRIARRRRPDAVLRTLPQGG